MGSKLEDVRELLFELLWIIAQISSVRGCMAYITLVTVHPNMMLNRIAEADLLDCRVWCVALASHIDQIIGASSAKVVDVPHRLSASIMSPSSMPSYTS